MITALLIFLAMFFYVAGTMIMSLWLYDQSGLGISNIIWFQLAILVWPIIAAIVVLIFTVMGLVELFQQKDNRR